MKIGIIGGGILSLTLGYYLSKAGNSVTVLEKEDKPGGLAGYMDMDGIIVDKYYHGILTSDSALLQLIHELGLSSKLKFKKTKMAFFHEGESFPMTTLKDYISFSPLTLIERCRLGYTVMYSLLVRNWQRLEQISVKKWLTKLSGYNVYENIWKPLLKVKFDGYFDQIPATYIWSRIQRMASTRKKKTLKEDMAYLIGGTKTLIDTLKDTIQENRGKVYLQTLVKKIEKKPRGLILQTSRGSLEFDKIVSTIPIPYFISLLPSSDGYSQELKKIPYLHILCLVLKLRESLSDFYFYHITDNSIPFTTIVETTNLIDPKYLNDYHIVYLPKYVKEGSRFFKMSDEEIYTCFIGYLKKMFPNFQKDLIEGWVVLKEKYAEPVHLIGLNNTIPRVISPIENLYLANTSQIYPSLVNCESIVRFAKQVSTIICEGD